MYDKRACEAPQPGSPLCRVHGQSFGRCNAALRARLEEMTDLRDRCFESSEMWRGKCAAAERVIAAKDEALRYLLDEYTHALRHDGVPHRSIESFAEVRTARAALALRADEKETREMGTRKASGLPPVSPPPRVSPVEEIAPGLRRALAVRMADAVVAREQRVREEVGETHALCVDAKDYEALRALVVRLSGELVEQIGGEHMRASTDPELAPAIALLADPLVQSCVEEQR